MNYHQLFQYDNNNNNNNDNLIYKAPRSQSRNFRALGHAGQV